MRERSVMLMGTASAVTLGLVAFALEAPRMQAEVEARTSVALADVGVRNLRVETNGRDVTLTGTVAFAEIGIEAARRAAETPGVRRVDNLLEMAAAPTLEFGPEGDIWLLRGHMPTPEIRQEIFDAAAAIVGQGNVIDETEVDPNVTEPPWLSTLPRLLQLLRRLDGAPGLRLEGRTVTLTGSTSSEALLDHLVFEIAAIGEEAEANWNIERQMRIAAVAVNARAEEEVRRQLDLAPIEFEPGTAVLTEDATASIGEVGAALARYSNTRIEILAHTDAAGDPAANRVLSLEQARAVRDVLTASIHPDRLLAVGYGNDRPPAPDEGGSDAPNQRIEFRVLHQP